MTTLYLAGPITGLQLSQARSWRDAWGPLIRSLPMEVHTPTRGKSDVKGVLTSKFDEGRGAFKRDLWDIDRCDIVLVNLEAAEQVSIGTVAEMGYAFAAGKFILLVVPKGEHPHDHLFIEEMASHVVHTMQDAYDWLRYMT